MVKHVASKKFEEEVCEECTKKIGNETCYQSLRDKSCYHENCKDQLAKYLEKEKKERLERMQAGKNKKLGLVGADADKI